MAYTAGNLEVTISGIDDNASASISTVVRRLNSLQKSLTAVTKLDVAKSMSKLSQAFNGISTALSGIDSTKVTNLSSISRSINILSKALTSLNNAQTFLSGAKLQVLFSDIATATNSINATSIANLASAAKSLSSLTRLSRLNDLDWDKIGKGFNNLTTAITPFLTKIKEAETSLTSLYGILQKVSGKQLQNLGLAGTTSNSLNQAARNINLGATLVKLRAVYGVARRIGSAAAQILQYGVDYIETLNLWQVAMRDNLSQAEEFVNKMNEAYGISLRTLMNAQAIFKNMLSGLGEIDDNTAYLISEAVTQMAVDYSSLYNVTLEDAFTKFQAALAGQVRPIRSVSGYDITETTLEQVYESLGGTKSIRNLSQTEKRLLSIYAIFQQMGTSGALGDMTKTLDNFANQSRMAAESWQELATWAGIMIQELLEQMGVMTLVNAALMTAAELMKALAYSMGYTDPDFGLAWEENIDGTNEAVDELTGKLLDFDKFRALSSSEDNALGIDETLLNALAGYSSYIEKATNEARELANQWLRALGFTEDENGELVITEENLNKIKNVLTAIGIGISVIAGFGIIAGITKIVKAIFTLRNALALLNVALVGGVIYAIVKAVEAFKKGDIGAGLLATAIGVVLVGAFLLLHRTLAQKIFKAIGTTFVKLLINAASQTGSFALGITSLTAGFIGLASAITGAFLLIENWGDMNTWQRIIGIIGVATTAILGLAMAFGAFQSAWSLGLAVAGIAAGIAAIVTSIATVKTEAENAIEYHALGASNIDGGTLFVAGEAGKTEAVYSGSNGKSNVANISQLKAAFYQALVEWSSSSSAQDSNINVTVQLDGETVYRNTTAQARRRGQFWSTKR